MEAQHLIVVHHLLEFVLAQHAVVDEDAGETVADGTVEQDGSHRRIDTAGETEDDAVVAQLLFEFCHGGVDKRGSTPLLTGAADVDHEILQQQRALQGVKHLGMELDGPNGFAI